MLIQVVCMCVLPLLLLCHAVYAVYCRIVADSVLVGIILFSCLIVSGLLKKLWMNFYEIFGRCSGTRNIWLDFGADLVLAPDPGIFLHGDLQQHRILSIFTRWHNPSFTVLLRCMLSLTVATKMWACVHACMFCNQCIKYLKD